MKELMKSSSLLDAIEHYRKSPKFHSLVFKTQRDYVDQQRKICNTIVQDNTKLGDIKIGKLSLRHVSAAYDQWLLVGTRTANIRVSALSVVIKFAMQKEVIDRNATLGLTRKKDSIRSVRWSEAEITKFVDTARSASPEENPEYSNIAMICQLAYDLGQRIGDMRTLTCDKINFAEKRIDYVQSKRGAEVHLLIPDSLLRMLQVQESYWGFQKYVCPKPNPFKGEYSAFGVQEISYIVSDIKQKAGLPSNLLAMDLRRSCITEMVEAGVDIAGIMQVSGHQNPQSVKPYLVNTFRGAAQALEKRTQYKQANLIKA